MDSQTTIYCLYLQGWNISQGGNQYEPSSNQILYNIIIYTFSTLYIHIYCWGYYIYIWTRGSIVGWDTILQIGRSRVRISIVHSIFSIYLILPGSLWSFGRQPLTEMSTRNAPGGKGRTTHKADLTAICELIVHKMWEPRRLTTLWASTACYRDIFTYIYNMLLLMTMRNVEVICFLPWVTRFESLSRTVTIAEFLVRLLA
jgi:hypothetical protein